MASEKAPHEPPDDDLTPPAEKFGGHAHTLSRAVLSAVPGMGGPAAELFNWLITPPLEKRRRRWMETVAEALRRLEEKRECVPEDLQNSDAFVGTVLNASQAVLRTANEEKRKLLRNAVLNAALPNPPNEARRQIFL